MDDDKKWTKGKLDFKNGFQACSGAIFDWIPGQLEKIQPNPRLATVHIGGNDLHFSDVARACIYQPYKLDYGPDYSEDPDRKGQCAQEIDKVRTALKTYDAQIANTLRVILKHKNTAPKSTFDLFVLGYVHFFNDAVQSECNQWTFALWQPLPFHKNPLLSYPLRRDLNDLVGQLNDRIKMAVDAVGKDAPQGSRVHYVEISSKFGGRRFCEAGHTFDDQYYGNKMWLWNLARKDVVDLADKNRATEKPPGEVDKEGLDPGVTPEGQIIPVPPISWNYGLTARPFHPKSEGHAVIKDAIMEAIKAAKVPTTIWG
jgi:hypothetical protein